VIEGRQGEQLTMSEEAPAAEAAPAAEE